MNTKYVSPFDKSRNAVVGEMVIYHHAGDGENYPAVVSKVRCYTSGGTTVSPSTHEVEDLRNEELTGELHFQAQLTVFRPRAIDWPWAAEHDDWGGFTRSVQ